MRSMFAERGSTVPGAVLWCRTEQAEPGRHLILPDGCMDLIWCDGTLSVAGPDTHAHLVSTAPGARYTAIRLPPGTAPAVLGVPAHLLRDRRVPLAEVWPAALARRAADAVSGADRRGAAIERLVLGRLAERAPDPAAGVVAARLRAGATVAAIAAELGLSERHLHRRCLVMFGYGAKRLGRIQRLGHVLTLARAGDGAGPAWADASGANASGANASRANAGRANASRANASRANASRANAGGADASTANAGGADAGPARTAKVAGARRDRDASDRAVVAGRRTGADLAAAAGYADQAHLAREVRALTGMPLRRLLAS